MREKADDMDQFENFHFGQSCITKFVHFFFRNFSLQAGESNGVFLNRSLAMVQGFFAIRPDRFSENLSPFKGFQVRQMRVDSVMTIIDLTRQYCDPLFLSTGKARAFLH